jgi:L,D-transpeptidase catalytic domain
MNLSERWSLLALCSVAAVVSAAFVHAMDQFGVIAIGPKVEVSVTVATIIEEAAIPLPPVPRPAVRPSYLALKELPLDMPPPADTLPIGEPTDQETPEWWSAEVRREAPAPTAGPRLSSPPVQRLPWLTQTPSAQPRDKRLMERLVEISPAANARLAEKFEAAKTVWPPAEIALVAIKDEKVLELFARPNGGTWKFVHRYPVLAASGSIGPKLRQGDKQVPEGVYGISFLNPDSRYHVSMRVNYPNIFDRQMADKDGRTNLGGDIMIHGKNVSAGCLAVGDEAAEELFVLAARNGSPNVKVIIAPTDFRRNGLPATSPGQPTWLPQLYTELASVMADFKSPASTGLLSFFGK